LLRLDTDSEDAGKKRRGKKVRAKLKYSGDLEELQKYIE
jgi:hypothetical protein